MGRTGVFITLSIVLERMQYEGVVDVFQTARILRTQRPAMVQTEVKTKVVFAHFNITLSHFCVFRISINSAIVPRWSTWAHLITTPTDSKMSTLWSASSQRWIRQLARYMQTITARLLFHFFDASLFKSTLLPQSTFFTFRHSALPKDWKR